MLEELYLAVVPSSGIFMSPFIPPQQLCPITKIFSTWNYIILFLDQYQNKGQTKKAVLIKYFFPFSKTIPTIQLGQSFITSFINNLYDCYQQLFSGLFHNNLLIFLFIFFYKFNKLIIRFMMYIFNLCKIYVNS